MTQQSTAPRTTRRMITVLAGSLVAASALAACAPGSSSTTNTHTGEISTDVAAAGDVTIKVSDFWGGTEGEWMDDLIARFEDTYPNVTIERTQEDWGQLTSTLNLQLAENDGPDIATANNGWSSLGTLAKGGLVLNLDPYADAYGWDDVIPSTIARQNEFTTDFSTIGSGSLFSTPVSRVSLIGIYYNTAKLDELGIDPPTTLDELEAAAAKAKSAGEIPFAYGSQDSPTALLLALQALYGTADEINDFTYGDTSVSADDIGLLEAAEKAEEWNEKGWLTPDHEGIDYQTAVANFLDGKGLFRFEYTGSLGLTDEQQGDFGYIQLPQVSGDGTVGVGAAPAAMVISSKSENPDVAAAFLDFLMSEDAAQASADHGLIPLLADADIPADAATLQSEAAGAAALGESDGFVPYFDWTSATMLDTLTQQLQMLYAGQTSPQDLVDAVQADRDAFLADLAQ
ncbi:ABC transporter substrate-binding protein [Homoserinibacter sp. GY 40078]|uniref:ABC transporter substrate-binding protein n=1 Tax=Homoserinibacter sp. GY 40078 TaxID=2603275 RepID=UPI0016505BB9|nr:extracellular solute-binding protein [Homoserinibacter sp. GY 40078]